jgi:hypothetical protein
MIVHEFIVCEIAFKPETTPDGHLSLRVWWNLAKNPREERYNCVDWPCGYRTGQICPQEVPQKYL